MTSSSDGPWPKPDEALNIEIRERTTDGPYVRMSNEDVKRADAWNMRGVYDENFNSHALISLIGVPDADSSGDPLTLDDRINVLVQHVINMSDIFRAVLNQHGEHTFADERVHCKFCHTPWPCKTVRIMRGEDE